MNVKPTAVAVFSFLGLVQTKAASNTWIGGVNSNWDTATANWTAPAIWANGANDAVFNAGAGIVNVIADITASSVTIAGASDTVNITPGFTLLISPAAAAAPPWAKITGGGTLELNSAQPVNGSANWGAPALGGAFTGTLRLDKGRINAVPANLGGATALVIGGGAQFLGYDGTGAGTAYTFNQNLSLSGMGWGEGGQDFGALRVSGMNATFSGNVMLTGASGLYTQTGANGTLTLSGAVSDAGGGFGLTVNAYSNPITLSGTAANSLSGVVTVNRGTLILSKSADTAAAGSLTIAPVTGNNNTLVYATANNQFSAGAVVAFNGTPGYYSRLELLGTTQTFAGLNDATTNGIVQNSELGPANAGTGTLVLNGSGNYSFASTAAGGLRNGTSGTIALTKGAGTQTLSGGGITYTGATVINGGVLRLVDTTGFNSSGITNNGSLVLARTTGAWTMDKTISGSGSVSAELSGGAVLTVGSVNSYLGATSISGGVVIAAVLAPGGSNSSLGAGTVLNLSSGGTLRYTGGNVGSDTLSTQFNRAVDVGAGGGVIDVAGTGFLFCNSVFTGSGALSVVDTSGDANNRQLLVTGNSPSFSGSVGIGNGTANSGWVQVRSNAASPLGSGTVTLNTGGILSTDGGLTSPSQLGNPLVLNGGTLLSQGYSVNFTGAVTAMTGTTSFISPSSAANVVVGGGISGSGTLQEGGGNFSVELRGDNTGFTGTYNHTGAGATLFYTANSASAGAAWNIPSGSSGTARLMAAAANATYRLGALSGTTGLLENLNAGSGNSTFEIGALGTSTTFGGTITDNGGTVGITKTGGGTLTLTGPNNYTGPTTINAGVLQIGDGGATGTPGTGLLTNNAALVINRSNAITVAGAISGLGTFTQAGAGTTTLSGGNTYAGTTYVQQGTLLIDGSTSGAGRIDVSAGATLGGGGTGGIVTVADGGIFAPGGADNDIELASLTLAGTPILKFNVDAPSVIPSFYNDYANIAGALVLNGRIQVGPQPGALGYDFTTAVPGDKWLVMSYTGALGGSGLVVDSAPALAPGLSMTVDTATAGSVFLAVVPESGTGALVMLGLALLLRRRFPVTGTASSKKFR